MIIFLVIIFVSVFILFDYYTRKQKMDMTANIPGPSFVPVIGTELVFQRRSPIEVMNFLQKLSSTYGPISRIWIFNQLIIFIKNPKLVEVVLSSPKHTSKNFFYKFMAPMLGDGFILSNGHKWFTRRKIVSPIFHFKMLEQFVDIFEEQSEIMAKQMESHLDGKEFDVYNYLSLAALDIMCETAMGVKVNAQKNSDSEYLQALTDFAAVVTKRLSLFWYVVDPIFKLFAFKTIKLQNKALAVTKKFTNHVINERRKLFLGENNKINADSQDDTGNKAKVSLVDVLFQSNVDGQPLSYSSIHAEVNTFLAAGKDTTSSATSFTFYLLSRHPDVQSLVFQEICDVIGSDKSSTAAYRDLKNLKYLDCVIKESLRMFPVGHMVARLITEDTKAGEYTFPAGSSVCVPILEMMGDPELFPEPEKFKPERHFPENLPAKMNPYSFIPFSAGPRNCIGQQFAMLEMKSMIAKVLRHYELLPLGPDPIPAVKVFLGSLNGMHIGIKRRWSKENSN